MGTRYHSHSQPVMNTYQHMSATIDTLKELGLTVKVTKLRSSTKYRRSMMAKKTIKRQKFVPVQWYQRLTTSGHYVILSSGQLVIVKAQLYSRHIGPRRGHRLRYHQSIKVCPWDSKCLSKIFFQVNTKVSPCAHDARQKPLKFYQNPINIPVHVCTRWNLKVNIQT